MGRNKKRSGNRLMLEPTQKAQAASHLFSNGKAVRIAGLIFSQVRITAIA
jgi:hypothetical protein